MLYTNEVLNTPFYSLIKERSYSEFYQYLKEIWISFLFLAIYFRKFEKIYLFWALFFLFLFLDDSVALHEYFGSKIKDIIDLETNLGLRPQDFGELIFCAIIGMFFLIFGSLFYFKSKIKERLVSINIIGLILGLVFFGVFIDSVHIIMPNEFFGVLEDGGELIMMSLIIVYVFKLEYSRNH